MYDKGQTKPNDIKQSINIAKDRIFKIFEKL